MHVTLKQAIINLYNLQEYEFEDFMLRRSLFLRAKVLRLLTTWFYRDFLFNEKCLVQEAGKAIRLKEVHDEVDFYQHKYVTGSIMKKALKVRVSGRKLISLAEQAFHDVAAMDRD